MNPKDILKKYSIIDNDYYSYNNSDGNVWITKNDKNITMVDVLNKFTPEQLIEAIGVDEVQKILRNKKLNILKKKLNK
jgi:hypothetical protein